MTLASIFARTRLGLAITSSHVRAVAVRAGQVTWSAQCALEPNGALSDALGDFFLSLPRALWRRPSVVVALDGEGVRVKRLAGAPTLRNDDELATAVRESAARFFVKSAGVVTSSIRRDTSGAPWAATVNAQIVRAVCDACTRSRVRLVALVPSVEVIGEHSGEFAAAYGAAVFDSRSGGSVPVRWPIDRTSGDVRLQWSAMKAPTLALCVSLILTLLSAPIRDQWAERRAIGQIQASRMVKLTGERNARELVQVTNALISAAAFDSSRHSVADLLAAITGVLPESSAIIHLQLDSGGLSLVALTPHASRLVSAVSKLPMLAPPDIVDQGARETVGGQTLDRVTIRCRLRVHG